jgi:hypothetical protein
MAPIMPGFAFITGVFGCYNHRVLDPVRKPKTIMFDAEIPIGENDEGRLQCVKGIIHYFVPSHAPAPIDDRKYFVSGKVVSISQQDAEEKELGDYDLQVEAMTVCIYLHYRHFGILFHCIQLFLMADVDDPPRCEVMVAGQVSFSVVA